MVRATGSYFDGQSAARQAIELELAHGGIRIVAARAGGLELAFWPYRELRLVDEPTGAGPWRIQAGNSPARLVIEDSTVAAAVWSNLGRTDARGPSWARLGLRWTVLSALSIAVLLAALWHGLPRVADEAARLVPRQWEAALGARMVRPLLQTLARMEGSGGAAVCTARGGRDALAELTRRLAPAASPHPFEVRVANLEMINAFALPGGQIVIAGGLIRFAESPDELAGILAHEMGHVLHRHSTAALIEALGLAFLFGLMLGDTGTGLLEEAGGALVGLHLRREAEAEADERALALLEQAGLSSQGLANFFERMQREYRDEPAVLRHFSTHPPSEIRQRLAAARAVSAAPALDNDGWRNLQDICRRQEPLEP